MVTSQPGINSVSDAFAVPHAPLITDTLYTEGVVFDLFSSSSAHEVINIDITVVNVISITDSMLFNKCLCFILVLFYVLMIFI